MSSFYGAFISSCLRTAVHHNMETGTLCEKDGENTFIPEKVSLYKINDVRAIGWDTNILYVTWCCAIMLYFHVILSWRVSAQSRPW